MTNPLGRPTQTFSRRRFSETVKCLKQVISNSKNAVVIRVRCCELLMLVYGISAPESRRDRETVRNMVMQHSFEKQLAAGIDRKIAEEDAAKQAQEQELADNEVLEKFAAVLGD